MLRLIVFVFVIVGLALVVSSVMVALRLVTRPEPAPKEDTMPKTFSTVAYVLLIVLMFGIVSGWLGAA